MGGERVVGVFGLLTGPLDEEASTPPAHLTPRQAEVLRHLEAGTLDEADRPGAPREHGDGAEPRPPPAASPRSDDAPRSCRRGPRRPRLDARALRVDGREPADAGTRTHERDDRQQKGGSRVPRIAAILAVAACAAAVGATASQADHGKGKSSHRFPAVIQLPTGFQPEGIEIGKGTTFYVGSVATGAIYRGDLRTGQGAILVPGCGGPQRDRHRVRPQAALRRRRGDGRRVRLRRAHGRAVEDVSVRHVRRRSSTTSSSRATPRTSPTRRTAGALQGPASAATARSALRRRSR